MMSIARGLFLSLSMEILKIKRGVLSDIFCVMFHALSLSAYNIIPVRTLSAEAIAELKAKATGIPINQLAT